MNERIRELYEQVRLNAKSIDPDIDPKGWMDEYHEKFAELIVRECADLFEVEYGQAQVSGDDVARVLKQHFGVE